MIALAIPVESADGTGDLAEIRSQHPAQTLSSPRAAGTAGFCVSQLAALI